MAMFRCGGGSGKIEPITVVVKGQDDGKGGGGTRIAVIGIVTLPNLGWTKVTCDANSNTVGGSSTVGSKVNGVNIAVGASRDITGVESIKLEVGSNMTGSGLYGHDKVTATFTLS